MDKEVTPNDWLASLVRPGNGEMGERFAALDWSRTPVGPVEDWPQTLKAIVKTLLSTQYPMLVTWGSEFTQFYNDGYSKFIGDKHPAALGGDCRVTLGESWGILGPMIEKVMATGVANWTPALLLLLYRAGYAEESYFSVSHSPLEDDAGVITGMLAVCSEVTQQVIGERRLTLLRRLAAAAGETKSVAAVCDEMAAEVGQHPLDVPFVLIYLRESDERRLTLRAAVGVAEGGPASPATVDMEASDTVWPWARAAGGETLHIKQLSQYLDATGGPWNDPVDSALVMPIAGSGQAAPLGVLIAGINPNRALDEDYRSFYELLAGQVSIALRNARAYQEERRRAEALAELDRAKTAFFSNVSHEFRTPLTLMLGPIENALASADKALRGDNLDTAYRNAVRLLKLVNTLLDFSRIESGRIRASYRPTELSILTADLASNFRSAVERAGLKFVVETDSISELIYVDRGMWENIVLNLLSNAFKFTFEGEIAVTLREQPDSIQLVVNDTGAGIPPAQLPHIFERFHRVQGMQSRTHEGSGIGLALVQELVNLHGGEITATSDLGRGAAFTVTIPKGKAHLPAEQVGTADASQTESPGAEAFVEEALRWLPSGQGASAPSPSTDTLEPGSRILLADDNADMRDYVTRLLGRRHTVEAVHDGSAALEAARRRTPDLVLSDVMMPGLNGFELLDALRQNEATRRVPVILLSARAGEESRIEGLEAGADDYLVKPFSARELVARVNNQLRMMQLRQDVEAEREAVKARDEFLSIASHELNTPLAALRLKLEVLNRLAAKGGSPEQLGEARASLDRQVARLGELIGRLLDVSRAQVGRLTLKREECELVQIVRLAVDQCRDKLVRANITVDIVAPEPVVVSADRVRVEQVVINLVMNAVKYARGVPLHIAVGKTADRGRLTIHDEGQGIAEDRQMQLFARFERSGSKPDIGGLGLGLYISRQIVEAHGGRLWLNDAVDHGACFVAEIPLID